MARGERVRRVVVDAFWSVDRALGGQRRPTRSQRWGARHPIAVGGGVAVVFALFLWTISEGAGPTDALLAVALGVVMGLFFLLVTLAERRRQRRLARLAGRGGGR
ncbi:hypothetical protein [Streptomyces sp. NPDC057702]|uniref:hypothetical protein n=1 Tax=unclassified Streptomyces TaxID=2593676 RepID=UPI0036A8D8C2